MVNAIILLNMERDKINEVAETLVGFEGVSEVYSVAGQYDLVVMIRVRDTEGVAALITDKMLKLDGIQSSETLIAFRAYSEHDLERMFSIGLEA